MPHIAFYRHRGDNVPRPVDASWDELVGLLGADEAWAGPCTVADCLGHDCPNKDRTPRSFAAWSPVRLVDGTTRLNDHVIAVTVLVLDLDGVHSTVVQEVARRLEGWRHAAHSTHADRLNTGGLASLRIAVALEAEVPAASWRDYRLAAIARLGLDDPRFQIDPTCKDLSRLYFLPSSPIGYAPIYERGEGAVLPLSLVPPVRAVVLPALAPPLPPVAIVPLPAAADLGELRRALAEHRRSLAHRADPEARERADLIGRVLAGEPIAEPGARGSTIYRLASICAFCWPVGTPVEAFVEVIRASMSATSTAPTPGSNSLEAVDHWPHAVDCFRRASAQRAQKAVAEEAERGALAARLVAAQSGPSGAAAPSEQWQSELVLNLDRTLRSVGLNALILLRNDPEVKGTVRWNAVTCSVEVVGGPLAGRHDLDDTITAAQDWLQSRHQLNLRRDDVGRRLVMVAHEYPFDPLREYLLSLKWDGIRRLDNWLVAYAGATPTGDGYVGFVGRKWMVSGVARALSPGCKADVVLVAEGGQGQAKSTALRILGGEFYAEAAGVLGDKDSTPRCTIRGARAQRR